MSCFFFAAHRRAVLWSLFIALVEWTPNDVHNTWWLEKQHMRPSRLRKLSLFYSVDKCLALFLLLSPVEAWINSICRITSGKVKVMAIKWWSMHCQLIFRALVCQLSYRCDLLAVIYSKQKGATSRIGNVIESSRHQRVASVAEAKKCELCKLISAIQLREECVPRSTQWM